MRPDRGTALRLACVVAAVLLLYGRTLGFDFTYLDDNVLILEDQSFLTRADSPWRVFGRAYFQESGRDHEYYRPLATATFWLDAQFSGLEPAGYHVTNVALHALSAALLFLLLRALSYSKHVALFGALVFAVHPALTSAVAWVPGRVDSLLTVFALFAWILFQKSELEPGAGKLTRAGHLVAWICALLTKETALVLPIAYAATAVVVNGRPWRGLLRPWPLFYWGAALIVYFLLRGAALTGGAGLTGVSLTAALANLPVLVSSLGKLVLPTDLSVLATREDAAIWPGLLALVVLALSLTLNGVRRERMVLALGCCFLFILPNLPASGVLELENRLYLPAIGVILWVSEVAERANWNRRFKLVTGAAGGFVRLGGDLLQRRFSRSADVLPGRRGGLTQLVPCASQLGRDAPAGRRARRGRARVRSRARSQPCRAGREQQSGCDLHGARRAYARRALLESRTCQ